MVKYQLKVNLVDHIWCQLHIILGDNYIYHWSAVCQNCFKPKKFLYAIQISNKNESNLKYESSWTIPYKFCTLTHNILGFYIY